MSEKERIIKLVWGVKSVKNDKLKCMSEYSEKDISSMVNKAYKTEKKGKMDKVEIITATVGKDDSVIYKRYAFDPKNELVCEECAINISVKNKSAKQTMTFEDKLALLESWMRKKNVIPKVGDLENEFDVGKFYQQSVTNANKMSEVLSTVEQYAKMEDD